MPIVSLLMPNAYISLLLMAIVPLLLMPIVSLLLMHIVSLLMTIVNAFDLFLFAYCFSDLLLLLTCC